MGRAHEFLLNEEGSTRYGYIPMQDGEVIGKSGLTIAAGVDVGQMNRTEFHAIRMSVAARYQLLPFVGLRGAEEVRLLDSVSRVVITLADVETISNYVFNRCIEQVKERWEGFSELPEQAQIVLISLAYNLGIGGSPSTSGKVARREYAEAIAELRDQDAWANRELDGRRSREADLLEEILS